MWSLLVACTSTGTMSVPTGDTGTPLDPTLRARLQFRFPIAEPERMVALFTIGVDHDPAVFSGPSAQCTNYLGWNFPWCYDEHDGTDFLLEGGFDTMDAGSATVVAAAEGVVAETDDGHYDRCHSELSGQIDCDGYEMAANYVILEHATGDRTLYWHLQNGSVAVSPGQAVAAGEILGRVGSSGISSTPHLHFELQDGAGAVIDPFAGPASQPETWWCVQAEPGTLPGSCEDPAAGG